MLAPPLKANGAVFAQSRQFHSELTAFRHDLHAHPALGFEEIYTWGRMRQAQRVSALRQGTDNAVGACFLHHSEYHFNDAVLPPGSAFKALGG